MENYIAHLIHKTSTQKRIRKIKHEVYKTKTIIKGVIFTGLVVMLVYIITS